MPLVNAYLSVAELKTYLGNITDVVDDAALERVISAACRQVDAHCGRFFYQQTAATRYYSPAQGGFLLVGDLLTVTALASDEDGDGVWEAAWAASDYVLWPRNAAAAGRPYYALAVPSGGARSFLRGNETVKLTGNYGWTAVPDQVVEASFLQAARLYGRKMNPYGVVGSPAFGQVTMLGATMDPDAEVLLRDFVVAGVTS